jgi:hypothetical protein
MAVVVSGAATGYLTRADTDNSSSAQRSHVASVIHLKIDYELRHTPPASRLPRE